MAAKLSNSETNGRPHAEPFDPVESGHEQANGFSDEAEAVFIAGDSILLATRLVVVVAAMIIVIVTQRSWIACSMSVTTLPEIGLVKRRIRPTEPGARPSR